MKRSREDDQQTNTAVFWIWLPDTLPPQYRRNIEAVMASQKGCDFYLICNREANNNLPGVLNLVSLSMITHYLETLSKEHSIKTSECIEFVECHEDLAYKDELQTDQHQCKEVKCQCHDAFVMLSDLLRVHFSLYLLLTRYQSVLYLDTDIEPGISPTLIPRWLSETTPIRLSRDDLLVDFDILGIHNSAIHFLREIQDWQNLLLHKKVSFHDTKNQLKRDLFNPLGNETISLPSSVSFVEKDNECIQMLTPPLTPISMTLWGLSNYEMRSLKMIHAFSI
tara:strand:- start:1098 stop:1937 length:840 start_codon:yes stop_codon:yes gene_type:complete